MMDSSWMVDVDDAEGECLSDDVDGVPKRRA